MHILALCGLITAGGIQTQSVDLDTRPDATNTIRYGPHDTLTVAEANEHHRLSSPTYLPAWAPVYPAAVLRSKALQHRDGHIIGRATNFETHDAYSRVVAFYERYYSSHGLTPLNVFRGAGGTLFVFANGPAYQSMVNIQRDSSGRPDALVRITIAQAAVR